MTLIWAYGQSGNEFYAEDELKYHSGKNRGRFTLGKNELLIYLLDYYSFQIFFFENR